jgi:4-amino-4-deoxy-L-arabinose transferase-like glycosyltransferase
MTNRNQKSPYILPGLVLVSITLLCLLPFVSKAFNIDDPLFIWTAKQIHLHPLDFYGFKINWYGTEMDASRIIKNPPLASYYLSLAASLFGWQEIPLHLAFVLPAIAAVLGSYFIAREFTQNPLAATLIGVLNPVFILSSTTVMCDTMMLAFYVWAIYFWIRGIKDDKGALLFIASVLVALSSLSKYFGISLIPLLLLYTFMAAKDKRRALFLLIPVLILCLYQWDTYLLYGRGLVSDAVSYAGREKALNLGTLLPNMVIGLSFTGGCLLPTLFFAPLLRKKWPLAVALLVVLLAAAGLSRIGFPHVPKDVPWNYWLQLSLFAAAGINLLALAFRDLRRHQSADALLLALWFGGTFIFATIVNWSVNGRSILPMAPVAGILVMRCLEDHSGKGWRPGLRHFWVPLSCAWLVSMAVTWADYTLAGTAREAATAVGRLYGGLARPVWFQGHWGFQYYVAQKGAVPYDRLSSSLQAGDTMVIPGNNTNAFQDIFDKGDPVKVLRFAPASFLTTMNVYTGAGFYSSGFGALPFLIDKGPEETYHVVRFPTAISPK